MIIKEKITFTMIANYAKKGLKYYLIFCVFAAVAGLFISYDFYVNGINRYSFKTEMLLNLYYCACAVLLCYIENRQSMTLRISTKRRSEKYKASLKMSSIITLIVAVLLIVLLSVIRIDQIASEILLFATRTLWIKSDILSECITIFENYFFPINEPYIIMLVIFFFVYNITKYLFDKSILA